MILIGHAVNPGKAEGEAVVTRIPFSFLGELDPETGTVPVPGHDLFGRHLAGKILITPTGKGSSAGPVIAWRAMKAGTIPGAIICIEREPILAAAAMTADIPMVDRFDKNPLEAIENGDYLKVDATAGTVEIVKNLR
jgi:predicted aconitase with swiveling domain